MAAESRAWVNNNRKSSRAMQRIQEGNVPRILFAALFHETHTFLSEPTHWQDMDVARGAEILEKEGDESPTDGFIEVAQDLGWEIVPTVSAFAIPSGPVADAAFERYWREFVERAAPALIAGVDAAFLVLHGAMATQSIDDAEGEFLARFRALPGAAALPVFGVLDLHANVSARMCALANGLLTYRKNPHTDGKITAIRAAQLLNRCLRKGRIPRMSWCRVPLLLAPPGTGTQSDPMLALTRLAEDIELAEPSVWAYNVAAGFSFADTPESGLTLSVVMDAGLEAARPHLKAGADLAWQLRDSGTVKYSLVDAVLSAIPADTRGPILLVEPADNIGAGAPGDGTCILRALIARGVERALVTLNDPQAVAELGTVSIGMKTRLSVGGRGWSMDLGPLQIEATLISRSSGAFQFEDPQNHLASAYGAGFEMGPCAVVRTGGVTLLLTSNKTPPFDLGQYRSQGIDPETFAWIGVKAAVGHRQAYDPIAAASYYVDTPGPCSSNLSQFPYRRLCHPVYPLDAIDVPAPRYA
jgi:microcystin degradation protein MlrC